MGHQETTKCQENVQECVAARTQSRNRGMVFKCFKEKLQVAESLIPSTMARIIVDLCKLQGALSPHEWWITFHKI